MWSITHFGVTLLQKIFIESSIVDPVIVYLYPSVHRTMPKFNVLQFLKRLFRKMSFFVIFQPLKIYVYGSSIRKYRSIAFNIIDLYNFLKNYKQRVYEIWLLKKVTCILLDLMAKQEVGGTKFFNNSKCFLFSWDIFSKSIE